LDSISETNDMKPVYQKFSFLTAFVSSLLFSLIIFAQEKVDIKVDADGGDGHWYAHPVAWIIGAAIFILLLVALVRGGSKS
jgi:hypothetical protein